MKALLFFMVAMVATTVNAFTFQDAIDTFNEKSNFFGAFMDKLQEDTISFGTSMYDMAESSYVKLDKAADDMEGLVEGGMELVTVGQFLVLKAKLEFAMIVVSSILGALSAVAFVRYWCPSFTCRRKKQPPKNKKH